MKYLDYAEHSLNTEIKALQILLKNSINDTFDKVVDAILNTKGRVILSGIGKPSYIAHKIAATLASTGTPAYYIHSDEASHGDLGMIDDDDIVFVLSSSGESKELRDIINYCKRRAITLIGVTRNKDSYLAEMSDIPVVLDNIEETNALNSPTTSSLMFLAYFDAIITTLISTKGFSIEEYKQLHPGGKLGASMLKVSELMTDKIPLCNENDTMENIMQIMVNNNVGCVVVVNESHRLVGIITDGDFKRKILLFPNNLLEIKVSEIMSPNPITININKFALEAVSVMQGKNEKNRYIQSLIVVDNENRVVGILHMQELLKAGVL